MRYYKMTIQYLKNILSDYIKTLVHKQHVLLQFSKVNEPWDGVWDQLPMGPEPIYKNVHVSAGYGAVVFDPSIPNSIRKQTYKKTIKVPVWDKKWANKIIEEHGGRVL